MTLQNAFADLALDSSVQELVDAVGTTGDADSLSTLVGLLKAIKANTGGELSGGATEATLSDLLAMATAIDGHVDGLEGKDFATQTTLASILAAVDQLEGYLDTVEAKLQQLHDDNVTPPGTALVDSASGTYAYAAGTSTTTVDVPAGAKLREVTVIAGASVAATVTIGGGNTITIPAGCALSLTKFGATVNLDVVIGGTIRSYYVGWTT